MLLCGTQGNGVDGRRFRWSLRPRRTATKTSSMPRLNDRKSNVEQWKKDQDQWAHHGFKVLGVEIGHLPDHQQVALLAGGVFFFLLIYGYMQVMFCGTRIGSVLGVTRRLLRDAI